MSVLVDFSQHCADYYRRDGGGTVTVHYVQHYTLYLCVLVDFSQHCTDYYRRDRRRTVTVQYVEGNIYTR